MVVEVRLPIFPERWEICGSCGQGEVLVQEVHVAPGDIWWDGKLRPKAVIAESVKRTLWNG